MKNPETKPYVPPSDEERRSWYIPYLPVKAVARWNETEQLKHLGDANTRLEGITRYGGVTSSLAEFLSGQPVVSLGCGSPSSCEDLGMFAEENRTFEAWMPRLAWAYGALPILGLDMYRQDSADADIFTELHMNMIPLLLKRTGLIEVLEPYGVVGQVKVLDLNAVFGMGDASSHIYLRSRKFHLRNYADRESFDERLKESLFRQAKLVLAEGGFLLYDYNIYKKGNKKLTPVYRLGRKSTNE